MVDNIDKYKKVSFLKNIQQDQSKLKQKKPLFHELKTHRNVNPNNTMNNKNNPFSSSFGMSHNQSMNRTQTSSLYKESDQIDQMNQTETRLTKTITTATNDSISSLSLVHNLETTNDLDKFKKMNKLLFFRSQKQPQLSQSHRETRGLVSEYNNNNNINLQKQLEINDEKQRKSQSFLTHPIFSARSKQSIDQSYYISPNKQQNQQQQQKQLDSNKDHHSSSEYFTQQKNVSHSSSFQQKQMKLNLSSSSSSNYLHENKKNSINQQQSQYNSNQSNQKNTQQQQQNKFEEITNKNDEIVEQLPVQDLKKQASMMNVISKIHACQNERALMNSLTIHHIKEQQSDDYFDDQPADSPLTKKLIAISKYKNKNNPFDTFENSISQHNNFMTSPSKYSKNNIQLISDYNFDSNNNINNDHQTNRTTTQHSSLFKKEQQQQQLEINNLDQYSKNIPSSTQNTPIFQHHFNKRIRRQIYSPRKNPHHQYNLNQGANTSSQVLIKRNHDSKSLSTNSRNNIYSSKTPQQQCESNKIYEKKYSETSICLQPPQQQQLHQQLERQKTHIINNNKNRTSQFFSSYVASTFKNSLRELRKRSQMQIYQKLSFQSRQALKRLVIYINDMVLEYANIKKVSQLIYQLIYHIPYLVNMLFQNEKILLHDNIDLNYISEFLTNKSNMDYNSNNSNNHDNLIYEQYLDNKIQSDIIFLNERLTDYIKRKFTDKFDQISTNIIEEYQKVQNLEQNISKKFYKFHQNNNDIPNINFGNNTNGINSKPNNILQIKHNYQGVDHYMMHNKINNSETFSFKFFKETKRLGEFNCIDQQNVAISHELDNLYTKVQNKTISQNEPDPFITNKFNSQFVNHDNNNNN